MKRESYSEEEMELVDIREVSEDKLQRLKERDDDAKAQAIKGIEKSDGGFAVFYRVEEKRDGETGTALRSIVSGNMTLRESVQLVEAMYEICGTIMDGLKEEMERIHGNKE